MSATLSQRELTAQAHHLLRQYLGGLSASRPEWEDVLADIFGAWCHRQVQRVQTEERQSNDRILTDMQVDSVAYLRGLADALSHVRGLVRHSSDPAVLDRIAALRAALRVPTEVNSMRLHIGNLEVEADAGRWRALRIDGRPIAVRAAEIKLYHDRRPEVLLDVVPLALQTRKDDA